MGSYRRWKTRNEGRRERKQAMSDNRVKVPTGQLEAALMDRGHLFCMQASQQPLSESQYCQLVKEILKAGNRWLSENPIVPTHSEVNSILAMVQFQSLRGTSLDGLQDFAAMWQRRMFLAPPEPEVGQAAKRVMENMMGCTFTPAEADAILRELSFVAHGWRVPSTASCSACDNGQSLERGEGTHREGTRQHPVEPQEESVYWRVVNAMGAVTLSRKDGDRILEYVRGAIHG